jgi:hypothetical protein
VLALELAVGLGEGRVALEQGRVDDPLLSMMVVVDRPLVAGVPAGQRPQAAGIGRLGGADQLGQPGLVGPSMAPPW